MEDKVNSANSVCKYRAEVFTAEQTEAAVADNEFEYVYIPLKYIKFAAIKEKEKARIIINPPVFLGGDEKRILSELIKLKEKGYTYALAHTIGHIELINSAGLKPRGGFRLNVTNKKSLNVYKNLGLEDCVLSIELRMKQAASISAESIIPTGIVAYGRLPFMTTRRCPVSDGKTCGGNNICEKSITDRKGNRLPLICESSVEILNPQRLVLSEKTKDLNRFDFIVFRFTDEKNIYEVKSLYKESRAYNGKHTGGLYYRGVK